MNGPMQCQYAQTLVDQGPKFDNQVRKRKRKRKRQHGTKR